MSSTYDFKNLEREAKNLKKEYEKHLSRQADISSKIEKLEFDQSKYGEKAIDSRIKSIFKEAKRKIENTFNSTYSEIKIDYSKSFSRLGDAAEEIDQICASYNLILENLLKLNENYRSQKFGDIIGFSETLFQADSDTYSYFLLLKANSYQALAKSKISSLSSSDTWVFIDYVDFCYKNNARDHLKYASYLCFEHLYLLIEKTEINDLTKYNYLKKCLILKENIPNDKINNEKINKIYNAYCKIYNSLANKYFNEFSYSDFVSLIDDSYLLKDSDIENEIIKRKSNDLTTKLDYFLLKGTNSEKNNFVSAISDLRPAIKNENLRGKFIQKTLSLITENNIDVFENLLRYIIEDLGYINFIKNINELLIKEKSEVNYYNCLINFFNDTIVDNKDRIPLLYTVNVLILISEKMNVKELDGAKTYFSISSSLIKSTRKYLGSLNKETKDKIKKLYDESYKYVYNKENKKNILEVKKPILFDDSLLIEIKKLSSDDAAKNKKLYIGLSIALGVVIISVVATLCVLLI
ncbi:hypothetical protein ACUZ9N_01450 [Mycoplasmopsis gallinarum]